MSEKQSNFCQYLPSNRKKAKKTRSDISQQFFKSSSHKPLPVYKKPKTGFLSPFENKKISLEKDKPSVAHQIYNRDRRNQYSTKEKIDIRDYNIFNIDYKIKEKLSSNISTIPELEEDLKKILWIFNNGDDPAQKVMAKSQASILRKRIQDLESTLELGFYIFRTADLIEEYRRLLRKSGVGNFVKVRSKANEETILKMNEILRQYICIAQSYIEIENLSQKPRKMTCSACQCMDFDLSPDDDSIYICKNCQTVQEVLDDAPSFKDTDRVNMSNKYTYSRKGHFIDAKKRFQGTQNTDPKKIQHAAEIVEEQMRQHNLIKEQGQSRSVSKDHVYLFLSEQNLSNHYEDLNLLFSIITGVPCPDISKYDSILDELFDEQESALGELKEDNQDNRTNSLNVNYKLYKLLQKVGYPCRKDDFHILKTPTKEDEHDEKMKEAWDKLGWKWIPTF